MFLIRLLLVLSVITPIFTLEADACRYRSGGTRSYSRSYYKRPIVIRRERKGGIMSKVGEGLSQGVGFGVGSAVTNRLLTPSHTQGYYNQPQYTPQPAYQNDVTGYSEANQQPIASTVQQNEDQEEGFFGSLWNTFSSIIWFWCWLFIVFLGLSLPLGVFLAYKNKDVIMSKFRGNK